MRKTFPLLLLLTALSCTPKPDPHTATDYDTAVSYTEEGGDMEDADTEGRSQGDWITSAEYDRSQEILIIGMNGKKYIFDGVPEEVWEGFKDADDMGKFYHSDIKDRYNFKLSEK